MAIRTILYHPDPRLRKACEPIIEVDDAVRALMSDMMETMYDAPGIGLAAPQIGVMSRVIVMDCAKSDEDEPQPFKMANPEIIWTSEETNEHEEGCLSLPEEFADVTRPAMVRVRYLDETGASQEMECDGLLATCVQHEIDHIDGKLFIDYLGPVKRQMMTNRMKKRKKERAANTVRA